MAITEIAVEIGTSFTSIFVSGNGIALREPTMAAFLGDGKSKRLLAAGSAAYAMLGKTPERTTLVSPVTDGVISDPESCRALLKEFMRRILPDTYFLPRMRALVGIPTGLTAEERAMYETVVFGACSRIKEITLVENIILSAVGIDLPITTAAGGLVANIGGGTTEIAAMSLCGVISGCGLNIGGFEMDRAILDAVAGKHNLKLGIASARKLTEEIGSLHASDMSAQPVTGLDIRTQSIGTGVVRAADIYETVQPYYARVGNAIEKILNMCPPDASAGGVAECRGRVLHGSPRFYSTDNIR
jgi:rod shape-determining protein MreB